VAATTTDKVSQAAADAMHAGGLQGAWAWLSTYSGKGGLILWPMFGATNQLLGGLAFLVIAFYLWRRKKPIWFLVLPLVFMLIMPAWAMGYLLFAGDKPWLRFESGGGFPLQADNWSLVLIAVATLALEAWMIVEAVLLLPRVKGVLEPSLPGIKPEEHALAEA
jgi:carbon starvation protein